MSALPNFSSLKEALADWQEPDVTAYELGRCLGVIEHDVPFGSSKPLVLTSNNVADMLYQTLDRLVKIKALEYDDNELRYRWNSSFKLDERQIAQPG